MARSRRHPPLITPALIADPQTLDFGRPWATTNYLWSVRLRNDTPEAARLERLVGDCSCTTAGGLPLTIAAGQSVEVELKLDLTRSDTPDVRQARPFRVKLTANWSTASGVATQDWELRGEVRTAVRVDPVGVDFGVQSERLPVIERVVTVETATEVTDLRCEPDDRWGTSVRRTGVQQFLLTIRSAGLPASRVVQDTIRLTPLGRNGAMPGVDIPVRGEVVPDVQPTPRTVAFGRREIGTLHEEYVRLRSLTDRRVRITAARSSDPALTVSEDPDQPGVFNLRLRPAEVGDRVAAVVFDVADQDGPRVTTTVPVHDTGVPGTRPADTNSNGR